MTASLLYKTDCYLGEGAFWHEARQSFFWVDIEGKCLYEYVLLNGKVNSWKFHHRPSMISLNKEGNFVIAFQGGLAQFDIQTESLNWLVDIDKNRSDIRTNDGAVDSFGRLWIGTMHVKFKAGEGTLYCIDFDLSTTKKIEGLAIPNGLVWSLDGQTMYHIDSPTKKVKSYSFDPKTAKIVFKKTVIAVSEGTGSPDGMCIDEEGMLWIAHWGGFGIYRWNPENGELLNKIDVPVPQPSCCAFGGESYDQLFITTARENLSPEQLKQYPDSGSVYVATPGVRGVKKNLLAGDF